MFDNMETRYHFPEEVDLDPDEPVILERQLPGTSEFVQCGETPIDSRDMESIHASVRNVALARGGEAWRAVTQRGEVLCAYSVYDLAREFSGKPVNTLHPFDQLCLAVARVRMGVSVW
jgi:hypothetical protein